ncbi:hypothetical protein AZE42_07956 [Rhizopogon vesiculosus]|uniref:NADAR domain-containing protein n=1 Tax=Rhizopogon vesiculosus TaxID=180088 RepID=A0A1J8QGC1_9AGAM|nr:hypothetical protein AZE42_07956 [Rhizopogon vesiculosus]
MARIGVTVVSFEQTELLSTGDAELVEDSDKDSFWGIGADREGQNQLCKALVRLRTTLRDEQK